MDIMGRMATRPMTELDVAASKYIQRAADKKGLTQTALAERAGIPLVTFGRYWRGQRSMTVGDFQSTLDALGVTYLKAISEIRKIMTEDLG